jgi:superfamily II DNA/RNA helicase
VLSAAFNELKVPLPLPFPQTLPALNRALTERKYEEPTPVQLAVMEEK